jgi:nicotinamidase-related amidase
MRIVRPNVERDLLVVVDVQPSFLAGIHEADRVLERTEFLIRVARLLGVPVLATEQYPSRMGGTHERILAALGEDASVAPKMSFSCCGCPGFMDAFATQGRDHAILVGIETHICVAQTALDLLGQGRTVMVCPDAVSGRTLDRHKLGMERMRDAGVAPLHTEAVAYEWMGSAENPNFREALKLVKAFA